jgi:quercetin dioxygenase-like cupin family protein
MGKSCFVRPEDVTPYSPANHNGTVNRRLIGPETVGAKQLELLVGTLEHAGEALPHAHPGIEQACYMLEGRARAEVCGESREMGPGECCFFPAGEEHSFTVVQAPVRVLVIYAPPYGENPANVLRRSGTPTA